MADTLTEGLSGIEIIDDVLAQTKRKLQTSCNFSRECNYGQGYSAEISVKIKAYAMDVTEEQFTVNIPAKVAPPVSTEEMTVTPVEIAEIIEIPQELDLEVVRERMKEPEPLPPPDATEENRMPDRLKRKYTRHLPSPEMNPMGGAVDLSDVDAPEIKF
jgi:hypothetical protein